MRILAVDPGAQRIGIALSDPTGTIANPLAIIEHTSRPVDAALIADLVQQHQAGLIVVGQSLDEEGRPTLEGRRARRLAAAIREQTPISVVLWDEAFSTQAAISARQALGAPRRQRRNRLDDLAATVILQSYLDAHPNGPETSARQSNSGWPEE